MRYSKLWFLFFCFIAFSLRVGLAQTAQDEFERGNSAYRSGQFQEAATAYENVLKRGLANPVLYFNLGNTYYRLGKTAPAILAYERALRLEPNDPDIAHNLNLVNLKTVDRIEPLPELFFIGWMRSVSTVVPIHTGVRLFILCWILFFASLATFYILSQTTALRIARSCALITGVLLIPLGVLLTAQIIDRQSHNDAIVTASVVTVKTSPDVQGVDAFVVHEGLKVKLTDVVGGWVKMVLPDGKVGWIRAQQCERI
ncbi:MAG: tetratricopeptide repeat protein [Ignavibacteriales bacterium]|nr:tetratricopeptide repeat protein [Ignavibacteriales bacterium]